MTLTFVLAGLIALQAAPETPQAAEAAKEEEQLPKPEIVVEEEKPEKITDRSHPDYIRCRSEPVIGSRAKRKRTCLSNREWARVSREGNRSSRDFVGDNQPGFQPGGS